MIVRPIEGQEPSLSPNATTVFERRYLMKDGAGRTVETPGDLLRRVAAVVSKPEARYGRDPLSVERAFIDAMVRLEFLPNSPTLINAGREQGQLAACFVLPVGDSLNEIFDAVKWAARIQQTGGGTGFSFSRLRPSGDRVMTTQGIASGPVSFIEVFNTATDAIRQGGVRRGANMGILRVDHPDILEFILAKSDLGRLRNFNLSVAITDSFMEAVAQNATYELRNPRTGGVERRLLARQVWDTIAQSAWQSGEPGVLFIDRINAANPTPHLGEMEATNPCGELPLLPFEACNLGSIDVGKLVQRDTRDFDWSRLRDLIRLSIRFLDNVIDANGYPFSQTAEITQGNRKVGLGIMGFADALIRMNIPYDSETAVDVARRLSAFVEYEAQAMSEELAVERGTFANWIGSKWQRAGMAPLRNATTTTIAPTGTISILAGCSSGIEPLYAISFVRQVLDGELLVEVHPEFVARARREGWYSEKLFDEVARRGSVRGLPGVPEEVAQIFGTAYDVSPSWHVRMQAAFQAHVHNAVSKTINFPKSATVLDIQKSYEEAYHLGCKGVTVYRDGSRAEQVLSVRSSQSSPVSGERCSSCGAEMRVKQEGACSVCLQCGYSKCL